MDESALLDLLECPVCLERLDASAKVLPCQHTFCKRCLLGIVGSRNELRCPECRTLVGSGVEELPSNILLVRLLDGIKQRPWKPGPGGGNGTNCTNALRAQGSTVANCGTKDLPSSQCGQQPRVQAWSPPVRSSAPAPTPGFHLPRSGNTTVFTGLSPILLHCPALRLWFALPVSGRVGVRKPGN
ncbi:E3 ubiquitin-protein ligase SH3RF1 [Microtus ochrogaster]|uniref:E3 ubiquitin-protein ligase SH3RF1 n=1 Tax=Microtus ochrogaster TaxID=79684 RepID=A0A8J6KY78_MICOH|nr:E3 ubiquitin-protein ligase SH3RF1 [Microtus ochrogaster]